MRQIAIEVLRRIKNIVITIDYFLYQIVCLGNPDPGESFSGSFYRVERDKKFFGFMRPFTDFLFSPFEKNHCYKSYMKEISAKNR